jgi:hypothetical protein
MPAGGGAAVQITQHGGSAAIASGDGQFLYYKRDTDSGPIYRIRPDGSGDVEVVPFSTYALLPFTSSRSGLWFVAFPNEAHPYWSLQMQKPDRAIAEAARLDFQPDGLQLSVAPDEQSVLVTRLDQSGTDLLLVDHFR